MPFCPTCGSSQPSEAAFCSECRTSLPDTQSLPPTRQVQGSSPPPPPPPPPLPSSEPPSLILHLAFTGFVGLFFGAYYEALVGKIYLGWPQWIILGIGAIPAFVIGYIIAREELDENLPAGVRILAVAGFSLLVYILGALVVAVPGLLIAYLARWLFGIISFRFWQLMLYCTVLAAGVGTLNALLALVAEVIYWDEEQAFTVISFTAALTAILNHLLPRSRSLYSPIAGLIISLAGYLLIRLGLFKLGPTAFKKVRNWIVQKKYKFFQELGRLILPFSFSLLIGGGIGFLSYSLTKKYRLSLWVFLLEGALVAGFSYPLIRRWVLPPILKTLTGSNERSPSPETSLEWLFSTQRDYPARLDLRSDFEFMHEPLGNQYRADKETIYEHYFVGRKQEIHHLVTRMLLSDGGAFLVTGYRGVGKTTFINRAIWEMKRYAEQAQDTLGDIQVLDVHLSLARPLSSAELMHHIVRALYERLDETDTLQRLSKKLRKELSLAYLRTSANVKQTTANSLERSVSSGDLSSIVSRLGSIPSFDLSIKHLKSQNEEKTFLGYDDKAAERDVIRIARQIAQGYTESRGLLKGERQVQLKIVFVFDEVDKLEGERTEDGGPVLDSLMRTLRNVFTTSGICFVFIAGKGMHNRWLADVGRGDSLYESVFCYDCYLPVMWEKSTEVCNKILSSLPVSPPPPSDQPNAILADDSYLQFEDFKEYLDFRGRGIPRRVVRTLHEYVKWDGEDPFLAFDRSDLRHFRFYADLSEALGNEMPNILPNLHAMSKSARDRRRLGVYYLVDWILEHGHQAFSLEDAIAASCQLSDRVALAEDVAPDLIERTLNCLIAHDYLEEVEPNLSDTQFAEFEKRERTRYRLLERRQVEISRTDDRYRAEVSGITLDSSDKSFGPYEITNLIGRGGFSSVYLARNRHNGRAVALKVLSEKWKEVPGISEKVESEVEILRRLNHPNVVQFYDVGETMDGRPYIVMEYLDGLTLAEIITLKDRLEISTALAIFRPIAEAIGYAHQHGVIRCDIKPNNAIVDINGRVVIFDFGTAKRSSKFSATAAVSKDRLGTPYYMSPEQAAGEGIDLRSDIYALGIILYEMLVGYPPFQADDPLDVLNQHISEDPVPPNAEINVPLPRDLEDVIMKCLAKSPENRYQLTDELLKALPTKQTINLSKLARRAKAQKKSMEARAEAGTSPVGLQESSHQSHAPIPNVHLDLEEFPVNTPYLFCTNGEDQGNVVSLREELAIGRNPKNDFALPDTSVSRYHAVVKHEENAFFVYDLNSGAGTYVDGVRIRRSGALRSGFIVQVGGVKLEFVNRDGPFFVHKRSHKLHRLSCHYVDESNLENLIYFARREVAISSGGIPCTVCNP